MNILPVVDGVINQKDAAYYFCAPFNTTFPTPPIPPAGQANPNNYRRPSETYINYRRQFGQANA